MQNVRAAVRPKIWVALSLSLYAKTGQTLSRPSALCLARAAPPEGQGTTRGKSWIICRHRGPGGEPSGGHGRIPP